MKLYDGTPQSKAINALIHDHNGASGSIINRVILLRKYVEDNNKEKIEKYLDLILEAGKRTQEILDKYITKYQNDFV